MAADCWSCIFLFGRLLWQDCPTRKDHATGCEVILLQPAAHQERNTMAEPSKGLPMTSKWDPDKLQREIAELNALESRPFGARAVGYIQRTGPGLLQSAMTLGAGSAAASVMAGASFGYKLLWVQPAAMFLGICMLAALGNVVLTTGERPYRAFGRELSRILAFLWALGTVVASVIWHFPQYGLAASSARDLAELFGATVSAAGPSGASAFTPAGYAVSCGIGAFILCLSIFTTWNYGSGSRGIKLFEWFLRGLIGLVILSFSIVVLANLNRIEWTELGKGIIGWYGIPETEGSLTLVLGMLGAAVGINMTFLYPYSLLAKGWGEHHKTLSRWDLVMSMFLPFVLVTSLVMVGMAVTGVYNPASEIVREGMKPLDASKALTGILGENLGRIIFDLGLIGMTCGAISTHMVVCGFTLCEMFGLEYTVWRYRLFTLAPAIGILGVATTTPMWLPIVASAICFTMLPVAYLLFFIMNNRRSYIGDAVGKGLGRAAFNLILMVAILMATIGAGIQVKQRVIDKLPELVGSKPAAPVPPMPRTPPASNR
ncbi:MAG: divalent metal cation transporter [Pirellulales bacterium]|nr:divalent metal cation transporter [Pirellulales bacterium]